MSTRARLQASLERHRLGYELLRTAAGAWAVVVPRLGARILGAGVGPRNALWVNPSLGVCLKGEDWNAGGQRTWLAPELGPHGLFGGSEREWRVPPALDPGDYRRIGAGEAGLRYRCRLELHPACGSPLRLSIERALELEDLRDVPGGVRGLRIRFEHALINETTRRLEAEVGLWSILQAPALSEAGVLLDSSHWRLCYGELPAEAIQNAGGRTLLRVPPGRRFKIGLPGGGPEAALAYTRPVGRSGRRLAVVLRTPAQPQGRYVDRPPDYSGGPGDVLQVYNSPLAGSRAFCELECHAPAPVLAPGEGRGWPVEISIFEGPLEESLSVRAERGS